MIRVLQYRPVLSLVLSVAAISSAAMMLRAQGESSATSAAVPVSASADLPNFDVATIKPTSATDGRRMFMFVAGGISITGVPAQMLIKEAFHVEDDHIVGAPGWVKTNRYDVQAKVSPDDARKLDKLTFEERHSMLVPLLVERFNLKYHRESRELPMYLLVVGKGGPKMKASEVPSTPPGGQPADPGANPAPGQPGQAPPQHMMRLMGRGRLEANGSNTQMLARLLSDQLGRTVIDKTGLTGSYDYSLQWTPDDAPPPAAGQDGGAPRNDAGEDAAGPSMFTALQEQLGLKLESSKGKVDVIVIDHIDLPSEN